MSLLKLLLPFLLLITLSNCNSTQKILPEPNTDVYQLTILMNKDVRPEKLEVSFQDFNLKKDKVLSFTENRWLFTFDNTKISSKEFIPKLKASTGVAEVKPFPKGS